jgi:hypothetical protein
VEQASCLYIKDVREGGTKGERKKERLGAWVMGSFELRINHLSHTESIFPAQARCLFHRKYFSRTGKMPVPQKAFFPHRQDACST